MSRRIKELLFIFVLGFAVALVPIACGGDSDGGDAGADRVNDMTQS